MEFDFGPISRTVDASTGKGEAINFASLPVHEAMTALLAATDRDEFVAWLWHDLFKPLFWWQWNSRRSKFDWIHYPATDTSKPLGVENHWSKFTKVPSGLVGSHHSRGHKFTLKEREAITNEFDQVTLGKEAHFLQLAFLAEPSTNTALLRAVIADAFMEVVTKATAQAIKQELTKKHPTLSRVRYMFEFQKTQVSQPPANVEIEALRDQYDMKFKDDTLIITHIVPVASDDLDGQQAETVVDFTDISLISNQFAKEVITLVELLTLYQDSRTILMGIPQFLQIDIGKLTQRIKEATKQRLIDLDIRTFATEKDLKKQASRTQKRVDWEKLPLKWKGKNLDLLAHVFAEQVEIRLVDERSSLTKIQYEKGGKTRETRIRPLNEIVSWPVELLGGKSRHCRFCNSAFESALPPSMAKVGSYFTDVEHVGLGGDICPMCRIYVLNSHKSRTAAEKAKGITGDRKGYRGAFALVMPASHFTYAEDQCELVEKPPLDVGGRFANPLQRATVTLQEYALFNMLSRRIIAQIWTQLEDADETQPLPLPYLGAILLTQDKFAQVQALFDCLEVLFEEVVLSAYPFEVTVKPAVELAFEMAVNDLQKHHTKHTYLKTSPIIVSVDPESKFTLLVDNNLQLEVNRQFFADRGRLVELLNSVRGQKRQHNWLLSVLQGNDPVTATAEAFYDRASFYKAEDAFWSTHMEEGSPAEQWATYEEVREEVEQIVSRYPLLVEFFRR